MAPNGGKNAPSGPSATPSGGDTERGGDSHPSPATFPPQDTVDDTRKKGSGKKSTAVDDDAVSDQELSNGDDGKGAVDDVDKPANIPAPTPVIIKKQTPKKTSRVLKMSEMECLHGGAEKPSAAKARPKLPVYTMLSREAAAKFSFATSGKARLVGIPATRDHIKAGALVEDGYGGLETFIQIESLGLEERDRLADHVTDDEDIHDFVLTPREAPLSDGDLDEAVKSMEFQGEMASILT
ncbi:hypothetical protein PHMEG_00015684 [Phytophthora megakarya]|uniref:Uncharacterized protein n=1 Tax=Phytophthora megakarya TaxID=4795 RepID=A0A225W1P5_9STRA|nr:hypothetical protein PHMEG_00015684 [Phytophthora megakarya]